jgi:hypothetical protein
MTNALDLMTENSHAILSFVGLFCSAAGTLIEKIAPGHRRDIRGSLVVVAMIGFAIAMVGTVQQSQENLAQKQQIGPLVEAAQTTAPSPTQDVNARLDQIQAELQAIKSRGVNAPNPAAAQPTQDANARLDQIQAALQAMQASDGSNRDAASAEPAPEQYYVQLASDASPEVLSAYGARLRRLYNLSDGFTGLVDKHDGANRYRLAFGQHLDKETAQRYLRIANNLGLSPTGQLASIELQPQP